ncbi:TPA: FAD-dependent thymidylate synthase [Bacillus cereus]|uniref:FAD-dependent thymidylate synthase n=1 Tax=Bacillus cereus TaxID=1396 RepID=UPI0019262A9B|nr:FAD-dependent thymidylate synthase [Bacillus cereus]MBL3768661.1 FAD-dependent thymidylate synthase [Bacillus cereus]MBL3881186.1 FAD-dependent thymidylate synthase [Bacillus cereus]HDR7980314.1 FAD-dependent thymidylate synthase [Bacillus cereus]HDR8076543.1 FAD-dependent thymidylate synthase [Bacillus cereus]HDR8514892.1 FAD-dependent thymidylate synthase [Bacillus cereus]
MDVKLLAHTQLSEGFYDSLDIYNDFIEIEGNVFDKLGATHGQAVALTAVRTCYAANKPSGIIIQEGEKYFKNEAKDGEEGTEGHRLMRNIVSSKHTSTLEHITFTYAIEGVSRALLAQLTRHRVGFSFSVQSQRYVKMGSDDKIGGFEYVVPETVKAKGLDLEYENMMNIIQSMYDNLRKKGIPAEDARSVLPNAACTNLVLTVNLRALLDFYAKRKKGKGAQAEITDLAERLRQEAVIAEPWIGEFFESEK